MVARLAICRRKKARVFLLESGRNIMVGFESVVEAVIRRWTGVNKTVRK